jgi:hypothetical protein
MHYQWCRTTLSTLLLRYVSLVSAFTSYILWSSLKVIEYVNHHAQEFTLIKSDPPTVQRRSSRQPIGQASGGPKNRFDVQPDPSRSTTQSDSRKRKSVLTDDEGHDAKKSGSKKEGAERQPKLANPRKKTSSRPMPKIRKSSRCVSSNKMPLYH